MASSVVTLVIGIITCVIGLATFVIGMKQRAKNDGIVAEKIEQALRGIEEIKSDVKVNAGTMQALSLLVNSHEERIKMLQDNFASLDSRVNSLLGVEQELCNIAAKIEKLN